MMRVRNGIVAVMMAGAMTLAVMGQAKDGAPAKGATSPVEVYVARARTQDAQGRHDLASANWRQVLLLSPRQPEALAALARYYRDAGDAATAKAYFDRLRAVQPEHTELKPRESTSQDQSILDQAAKLSQQHRYPEALDMYRKVLGDNPTSGDWAVVYYQTEAAIPGEQAHAVQGLRSIVSAYPANPNYALALAKVLTYAPATRPEGLRMLQELHGSPQATEEARTAWREALLWDPWSAAAQKSGAAYLERYPDSELASKLRAGEEARERTESMGTPEEAEAYKSLQSGDLASAGSKFSELLKRPGQSARAHLGLGYVAMKQQDFESAVSNLDQARNEGLHSPALDAALHDARYWQLMQRGNKAFAAGDDAAAATNFDGAAKIDPNRPEANEALAGLWVKKQQPEKALLVLREVLRAHSDLETAWLALADAELQAGEFSQVLTQQKSIPSAVQEKLNQDPDYLASLASAQLSLGNDAEAQAVLKRLYSMAAADGTSRAKIDLKLAELMLRLDRVEEAVKLSRSAVQADRSNPDGWHTLIRAEDQAGRDGSALQLIENVPAPAKDKLMRDPGFLIQAASIYQKEHEYDGAAMMLQHAQQIGAQDLQTSIPLQLQLASLDLEMGRTGRAYEIYRQLTREAPDRSEGWVGLLSAMHAGKHDTEALETAQSIPAELRFSMRKDTAYLQILASIYSGAGDDARAMECLHRVTQHYHEQGIAEPFAVNVQLAWLQLNAGDEAGLSASLDSLSKSTDMSPAHKKQVEDLWVAWSIRRAEATLKTGGADQAFKLLEAATEVYPANADLRHEIGTLYIRRGQPESAYRLYERFEWDGASEADFAGAIAAAAASNHWKQAEMWLHIGLNQYPGDRQLLTEAAQIEQDHGDLKKAETYWSSLRALDDPSSGPGALVLNATASQRADGSIGAANQLAVMLMTGPDTRRAQRNQRLDADEVDSERNDELFSATDSPQGEKPEQAALALFEPTREDPVPAPTEASGSGSLVVSPVSVHVERPAPSVSEMAAEMQSEQTSNSAWSGQSRQAAVAPTVSESETFTRDPGSNSTGSDWSSSDAELQHSASGDGDPIGRPAQFADALNLGASAQFFGGYSGSSGIHPMILSATGVQSKNDGLASLQAQMSPWVGGGAAAYSRSGEAGFDQLMRIESTVESSGILGQSLRLTAVLRPVLLESGQASSTPLYAWGTGGTAPTGNQYQTGVGGEVQVASAHIQASLGYSPSSFLVKNTLASLIISPTRSFNVHIVREPVKDTLLSYSGLTDTKSGQIWGGVVSTRGGVQVGHGDARSGFYALLDYANLTGRNVMSNTRISGSMGGYWKAYQNDFGALTVGLNMTGLHYDKDLQYFTFGQGGYFSPDVYMLINMPVTWQSKPMQNFSYVVSGSVGTQSYQQGAVVAGSLLTATYSTPSASANYALDARGSYRITPNWYLEAFLAANNTYDYQQRTAGFSLKYMTRPHSASDSAPPTGLFDVETIRPLLIP